MGPSDVFVAEFENACAKAAGFELKARMAVDLSPLTSAHSVDSTLDRILSTLKSNFPIALDDGEWKMIDLAKQVRNKIFHGELHRASSLIESGPGGVVSIDITGLAGGDILRRLTEAADGGGSPVHGTNNRDSGVFGWLLESHSSGAFSRMEALFLDSQRAISKIALFINSTRR